MKKIKPGDQPQQIMRQDDITWINIKTQKPRYYDPINIWDGKNEILYNWARVSNGENDYYVNTREIDGNVIYNITHWSPPKGVKYPKYDPLTTKDLPGYDLKQLIKTMKKQHIPYQVMTSWNRDRSEGYNDGVTQCIKIIERKLKKISKQ